MGLKGLLGDDPHGDQTDRVVVTNIREARKDLIEPFKAVTQVSSHSSLILPKQDPIATTLQKNDAARSVREYSQYNTSY